MLVDEDLEDICAVDEELTSEDLEDSCDTEETFAFTGVVAVPFGKAVLASDTLIAVCALDDAVASGLVCDADGEVVGDGVVTAAETKN